jgi:hypothetical protein
MLSLLMVWRFVSHPYYNFPMRGHQATVYPETDTVPIIPWPA